MTDMDKMMIEDWRHMNCAICGKWVGAHGKDEHRPTVSTDELERTAYNPQEVENLTHDLKRQMTIANIECNEVERLKKALRCAEERFHMAANAIISPDTLRRWSRECNDALNNRSALSPLPQGDG